MARDLTLKMALTWVGVPELGWYIWNRNDVHGIKAKYAVAQQCNLDNMADARIDAFEELKAKFEAAQEAHIQEIVEWEKWSPPADNPDMRRPPPPVYKGPTEMNLKIAEARVKTRQWMLENRRASCEECCRSPFPAAVFRSRGKGRSWPSRRVRYPLSRREPRAARRQQLVVLAARHSASGREGTATALVATAKAPAPCVSVTWSTPGR